MTPVSQAKHSNLDSGQAGWILDYWVASLIAAMERAIRRRCAKQLVRMQAPNILGASTRHVVNRTRDSNS